MQLSLTVKDKIVVELGVWRGDFSQTLLEMEPKELHLIDPWVHQDENIYNDILNLDNKTNEINYQFVVDRFKNHSNVFIHRLFSHEAVRLLNADLIYIDANHSYESVLSDLNMWYPKVKETISGHDLPWASVKAALETFCKSKKLTYTPIERESWRINL